MPPQSAIVKIVLSIVLSIVAGVIHLNPFGLVSLAALVLSVLACIDWAKAKGLSPWWGAIGLLGLIGWIVMFFVPGRSTVGFAGDSNSNYPR
ncbi:hypothetical protein EON81_26620 [bacterium]|nr:MAG: hypothetical protein EON81_26620 [bacterium]